MEQNLEQRIQCLEAQIEFDKKRQEDLWLLYRDGLEELWRRMFVVLGFAFGLSIAVSLLLAHLIWKLS